MDSAIIDSVISLFIMILVGVYGAKKKIITKSLNNGLVDLLIQITLPFMILASFIFAYDDSIKADVTRTFYYSIGVYLMMIIASYLLLLPVRGDKKTVLHFANVFTNTGYVGFPILHSVYGTEGVVYGSIFNMFFVILVWTYGIILYQGTNRGSRLKTELKKILVNPSILAVGAGLIIMFFDLQLPNAVLSSVRNIGNMTGPLSMIIIGVILSEVKIRQYLKDWTLYYGIATKLILIPLIIYLFSLCFGETSRAINTVVIMAAMPASTMTSILAERFNKEKEYAVVIVSITTLLSLVTVTLLLKILT